MNGIFPATAMPAATPAIFCSATPISTKRSGNSFWNPSARALSDRSAQSTTIRESVFPASTTPFPNPSRVDAFSISVANTLFDNFASGLSIFVWNFTAHCANLFQKSFSLFFRRRFTVPAIIKFYFRHALTGDSVCDDKRRLLVDSLRLVYCVYKLRDVVPVYLQHVPIERAIFIRNRL